MQLTTPAVTRPTLKLVIVAYSSGTVVAENISCVIFRHRLVFLCTPDHFVIDYYGSRERHVRSYTWRNFCCCIQCSWCFCACFGSTVSLIVHYVLYALSECVFRAFDLAVISSTFVSKTAQMINPNDSDWERTPSGRLYSYRYGYGVLDAYAFVTAAQKWEVVKPQTWVINRYHVIRRREDAKET